MRNSIAVINPVISGILARYRPPSCIRREIAAMAMTDAICRMVPGVLADPECFEDESHFNGMLEYPQYSRPAVWHGREVPAILLSGNHEKVRQWRRKQALRRTRERRPDMYEKLDLSSKQDKKLLKEMEAEDLEAAERMDSQQP